jgi:hypothetical protein
MGANAQTAVPAFVSGEVLTAAEMTQVNTGIPVFATTVTRDAAFGGAGEKVLAQGQYAYIEATSTLQVYTGAAWITANPNGLTLVKAQTIGTTVASVEVTGAFSATYENYLITISGGVASGNVNIAMILGATTANYAYNNMYMAYSSTTVNGEASNSAANWLRVARGSANSLDGEINLKSPFEAKRTTAQFRTSSSASNELWSMGGGYLNDATSYTAFTLTPATGTLTGGTIRVYGYQNS